LVKQTKKGEEKMSAFLDYCEYSELAYNSEDGLYFHPDFVAMLFDEKTDTQCAVFLSKGSLVFAFRGTSSGQDLRTDIKIKTNGVGLHRGFYKAHKKILPSIIDMINKHNSVGHVVFTGHSLGGALAAVTYIKCCSLYKDLLRMECYTYGQPKFCNKKFTRTVDKGVLKNYQRIVNSADPVPLLLLFTRYKHIGNLTRIGGGIFKGFLSALISFKKSLVSHHFIKSYKKVLVEENHE